MKKRVTIKARPNTGQGSEPAEKWITSRDVPGGEEEMKRLTIDVPARLHRRIKAQCASRGLKMADEIRELLERHYPAA